MTAEPQQGPVQKHCQQSAREHSETLCQTHTQLERAGETQGQQRDDTQERIRAGQTITDRRENTNRK